MNKVLEAFKALKYYIDKYSIQKSNIKSLDTSILGNSGLCFEYESDKLSINILFWSSGIIDISSIFIDENDLSMSKEILFYIHNPSKFESQNNEFSMESINILIQKIENIKNILHDNFALWNKLDGQNS